MAPAPNLIRGRILHPSSFRLAAQSPNLHTLVCTSSSNFSLSYRGPSVTPSTSRSFWWGGHGYRNKYSSGIAAYHKFLEARNRIAKSKSESPPLPYRRSSYPIYYSHGHGWRLASSWGKSRESGNKIPEDRSKSEADREKEWKSETERWQEEVNTYLDRLRKRVESQPYDSLFGSSMKNGVWNPWGVDWDNWMRNLGWKDLVGGKLDRTKPESGTGASQGHEEGKESKQPAASAFSSDTSTESSDIDLITLRRRRKDTLDTQASKKSDNSTEYDIPVKKFKPSETPENSNLEGSQGGKLPRRPGSEKATNVQRPVEPAEPAAPPADISKPLAMPPKTWLAKEGFSEVVKSRGKDEMFHKATNESAPAPSVAPSPKLESSLERHRRTVGPHTWEPKSPRSSLSYSPEENKTEDIDLLRASNVRAAAGHLKRPSQETAEAREARQKILTATFEKRQQDLEQKFVSEVRQLAATEGQPQNDKDPLRSATRQRNASGKQGEGEHQGSSLIFEGLNLNKISSDEQPSANVDAWEYDLTPKGLETAYQDKLDNKVQSLENYYARQQQELVEAEMVEKRKAADAALAEEIKAQKAAMMALEDRRCGVWQPRNENAPVRGEGNLASLSRWYKGRAPHAAQPVGQKAKDVSLVREIRQIYEDRYGTIDAQHRQPGGVPSLEGREDPAVQEGLRAYSERAAVEYSGSGNAVTASSTDLEQSAVQEGLREYDEKLAAEGDGLDMGGRTTLTDREDQAVPNALREYDEKTTEQESTLVTPGKPALNDLQDPGVQEGLREYDEKMAENQEILGSGYEVASIELTDPAVQEGLREYDEKIAIGEGILGANDAVASSKEGRSVQEGLREYDGKIAAEKGILGAGHKATSSELVDPAVQDALCEYDEKAAVEDITPPTKGRIASTDLDNQEIALLAAQGSRNTEAKAQSNIFLTAQDKSPLARPATSTYKILAYDQTTDSIATATTTSPLHESLSSPRSASSILTHLENPAKYFDHFEPLEAAGYELVAGSRKSLIFKKIRGEDRSNLKAMPNTTDESLRAGSSTVASNIGNLKILEQAKQQLEPHETPVVQPEAFQRNRVKTGTEQLPNSLNPIEGAAANKVSSTATNSITDASHESSPSTLSSEAPSPLSTSQTKTPIRREEEVFSGRNIIHEQRHERKRQRRLIAHALRGQESRERSRRKRQKVWRNVKRFFWTGTWVAGCCYLVGALLEEVYRPRRRLEEDVLESGEGKGDVNRARNRVEYYDWRV